MSYSRKRAAVLGVVCLVLILGSVELMNLQVRSRAGKTVVANKAAFSPARYSSEYSVSRPEGPSAEAGRPPDGGGSGTSDQQPLSSVSGTSDQQRVSRASGSNDQRPLSGGSGTSDQQRVSTGDVEYLRSEGLQIPVAGVNRSQLRDSFSDARGEGRRHEAIDIPAPRATPVVSASDGIVARLFNSRLGGTTLYCFDKTGQFVFYYAHLSGYADGIAERKPIRKGEVLAYVGNTGDAGPGNFHLHFSISKASTPWKWYGGDAIDPYPLLGGN